MARNPPAPMLQGELDGLCGVYSIVNAVQWTLHTSTTTASAIGRAPKRLTDREQVALFDRLVAALGKRRPFEKFVTGGVSSLELPRLLHISREWLSEHRNAVLVTRRPFYGQRAVATPRVVTLLTDHLAAPGSAVIVAVERPLSHWTVIMRLSRKRIRVFDSGYRMYLKVNGYRGADRPNGVKPGSIFLLRLSPKADVGARRP
jgi:hypothetical protein